MTDAPIACNGFLNIGDQHLAWDDKRPSRRAEGYWRHVMVKINHSIEIANERRLIPLFLGDLFHVATGNEDTLKSVLLGILARSWAKPVFNVGNHDKKGEKLSAADSLSVIAKSDRALVMVNPGLAGVYDVNGVLVAVGASPYGAPIPHSVEGVGGDVGFRIWMTHHDMAFAGSYPGSIEPHPIKGCDVVLNGHMHLYRDPARYGGTIWCNFGSIARTSIDAINETPSAFEVVPGPGHTVEFFRHALPHPPASACFSMVDRIIEASPVEIQAMDRGAFVEMLRDDLGGGVRQSHTGHMMRDEISSRMEAWSTPGAVQAEILSLHDEVISEPSPN
ncbi:MAG: hypothetical protein KGL63_09865 [Betaproteobacteria bacterium]|uniref:hypothetical protein n=1 Tax=Acidiphilium TaxID=522 RepID=UPI00157B6F3D|nr:MULTISPECIES: hypothetical protein [Acidiphilium]MDE2343676.1 hypothetical protein [Betaproteobacteria bacterium]UNC16209.1 hypothetical protein FE249_18310 [Acidiphilium multivorum]